MHYPTLSRRCLAFGAVVLLASWGNGPARGAEVNFWLAINENGPQTPVIEVLAGGSASVDIWARPESGMTLGGFSLNLDSSSAGLIAFSWVEVLNPAQFSRGTNRHQLVFDSYSSWSYVSGNQVVNRQFNQDHLTGDRIEGFMGGTFLNDSDLETNGAGIGPSCGDIECKLIGGEPAWKVATVDFEAGGTLGSTELFLEIGEHGIWHFGETATSTTATALFGNPDDGDPEDRHTWTPATTGVHSGLPDAIIHVVSQLSDADFDDSGRVDGEDFLIWQRGLGVGTTHGEGDADLDGMVDDYDLQIWEAQYGSFSPSPITAVPEPTTFAVITTFLALAQTLTRRSR